MGRYKAKELLCGVLLTALLSLIQAAPTSQSRTAYACEGSTVAINCSVGHISIEMANWGRRSLSICNDGADTEQWSTQCYSTRAKNVISNMCDGKQRCWVQANNRMFHDPCPDTPKYLRVDFTCVKVRSALTTLPMRPHGRRHSFSHYLDKSRPTGRSGRRGQLRHIIRHSSRWTKVTPPGGDPPHISSTPPLATTTKTALNVVLFSRRVRHTQSHLLGFGGGVSNPPRANRGNRPRGRLAPPLRTSKVVTDSKVHTYATTKSYVTRPRTTPTPTTMTPPTTTTMPTTTPTTTTTTTTHTTTTSPTTTPTTTTTEATTTTPTTTTQAPAPTDKFCDPIMRRDIQWPRTKAGMVAMEPCPYNTDKNAQLPCGMDGIWWEKADMSRCQSKKTIQLTKAAKEQPLRKIVPEVVEMSNEPVYGGDVVELTSLMEEMVEQVEVEVKDMKEEEQQVATKDVSQGVVLAGSNLLAKDKKEMWDDLPQADQKVAATRLLTAVEKSGFKVANTIKEPLAMPILNVEINIILEVNVVATTGEVKDVSFPRKDFDTRHEWQKNHAKRHQWQKNSDCIHIPGNAIKQMSTDDGLARLIFATYSNLQELLSPQQDENYEKQEEETNQIVDVVPLEPGKEITAKPTYPPTTTTLKPIPTTKKAKDKVQVVNSNIISASINNRTEGITKLAEPVTYTLEHKTESNIYNPTCSFWEYSERTMNGRWSTFGCQLVDTNVTHTVCQCEHLTNFAVLMDVIGTKLAGHHLAALTAITNIGCILSLLCLLIAWLTFQFCKNLQCDRNTIHKNLVFCLFIAEIVFLAGIAQHDKPVLCSVIAGVLHYLFLVAFSWMCLEGVQLYMMLIKVFEAERSYLKYYYVAAYGIPAIIVAISAAIYHEGYGTDRYCWLSTERGFIWAFVGPVMAVVSVNIVMLSIAIYVMCRHAAIATSLKMKEKSRLDNIKKERKANPSDCPLAEHETEEPSAWATHISWVKGAAVLVVLLGLTWTFGLLFLSAETAAFAYIFTILNSLQGLFIFVFHCLMNEKVQKEYKRCARRMTWLPDCIRVKYGGAKPYTSTSPHSTSSGSNYFQRLLSGRRRKRSSTTTLQRSSTPSTKWNYQGMNQQYSSGGPEEQAPPVPPFHTLSNASTTEDPEGYLEPACLRIHDSIYAEPDSCCNGDLSMIDGSVVDSAFVSEYCRDGGLNASPPPIDVDKYKIKKGQRKPRGLHQLTHDDPHTWESEYSDAELFNMTGNGHIENVYEECPLVPPPPPPAIPPPPPNTKNNNRDELKRNLMMNQLNHDADITDDDTLKLKKRCSLSSSNGSVSSEDSISKDSNTPSLNDLNKDGSDTSRNSIYLSTPNIKFKAGTGAGGDKAIYEERNNVHNSSLQRSMPNLNDIPPEPPEAAMEKLSKALSSQEDGLITLSHGGQPQEDNRLSKDTTNVLASHNYRLTSSDC